MPDIHGEEEHASYVGIPTFIHAPLALTAADLKKMEADIAIIGAPAEMVIYRPGARFGPRAIRQAGYVEHPNDYIYHMELEVHPTRVLNVVDFGDAACPPFSIERSHQAIQAKVAEALEADAVPIVLGGDHSVTLPSATAVAGKYGFGNVGIVHFDAHADTWDSIYGSLVSHGSPMRRLIESGAVPGKNFVQVGLRGYAITPKGCLTGCAGRACAGIRCRRSSSAASMPSSTMPSKRRRTGRNTSISPWI